MIVLPTSARFTIQQPVRSLPNVITSFNETGYARYGEKFVTTFLEHWSPAIRLTVYYEGENFPFTSGISWRPMEEVEFLDDYLDGLRFPIMHGIVGGTFQMNYDARQARKVFMEMHALKFYGGKVFWIDADVETFAHVPEDFLDRMLPDDKFSCYLGRDGWYHTESGFIGFNGDHPLASRFAKHYLNVFITGQNFTLPGWHDCWGYDAVRKVIAHDDAFVNLAAAVPHGTMHPFINSELGRYMNHRKGDRKDGQAVKPGDLVTERGELYWKSVH